MRIAGSQIDLVVGDLEGNTARIIEEMEWATAEAADVLLLPELAIPGYPPEDLILRPAFVDRNREIVERLAHRSGDVVTVVGFVDSVEGSAERGVANAVAVLGHGRVLGVYHKVLLPNYGVFDEERYFVPGTNPGKLWDLSGVPVGISICEDIWSASGPPAIQAKAGAKILLNVNGSPFHRGKGAERERMLADRARAAGAPVVYLNLVGGQDELVFDGASVVIDAGGTVLHRSPQFAEDRFVVDLSTSEPCCVSPLLDPTEEVYRALCTGVDGYVRKNGFVSVVVGLSGGIDSALTATLAADALGPENVRGVTMPTRFSSEGSVKDSEALARNLGIEFDLVPIDEAFQAQLDTLSPLFEETELDVTEENLQARIRGAILMAISNKFGPMVLATGNKSEMAVGYATLYGDMVGGYAPLKDVFKTLVYDLARWRNRDGEVIPESTITKPPSAELRPDQRDSDSLPPYDLLDEILERYIERDLSAAEIVGEGFDEEVVVEVIRMVDRSEYKRRQAAPGVKVTTKAFGRDRRLPITNRYREQA